MKTLFKSVVFSYFISSISGIDFFSKPENIDKNQADLNDSIDMNILGDLDSDASFEIHHYTHQCYSLMNDLITQIETKNFLDVFFVLTDDISIFLSI